MNFQRKGKVMEINNYMTPAEAAFRWGIPERTLREKFIMSRREHLIKEEISQGLIKYFVKPEGKRGEWIISVKAMEKWYGPEPKNKR